MRKKSKIIRPDLIFEKDVEKEIKGALRKAGIFHWKHWGGGYNPAGIPDLLGIYMVKVDDLVKEGIEEVGLFLGIEVKRPGKGPDENQERWIKDINDNHAIGFWTDNVHLVIRRLGLIERAHPLFKKALKDRDEDKRRNRR